MSTGAGTSEVLQGEQSGTVEVAGETGGVAARSPLQLFWRRFRKDKVAMVALGFIAILLVVAILSALKVPQALGVPDPNTQNTTALDDFGLPLGPNSKHWFGADQVGRDVFARVLSGAEISLAIAFLATGLSVVIGVVMGMIAGFYRGWIDTAIARLIDILLSFPVLLLGLGLATACSGRDGCVGGLIQPGFTVVLLIIVLASWPYLARIIRGQVLSLREKEFIEAARSLGASNTRIIFREILPNLVAPIIVYSTLFIPTNILFEAALSFLGVGVQPPQASWGKMLSDATEIFDTAWWYMFFPGMALLLTVLAFNLVGDSLQDALNPKSSRSR